MGCDVEPGVAGLHRGGVDGGHGDEELGVGLVLDIGPPALGRVVHVPGRHVGFDGLAFLHLLQALFDYGSHKTLHRGL